jgi:hypothetical protein
VVFFTHDDLITMGEFGDELWQINSLTIDKPSRSDQLMVAGCVVRELAGLCAQWSYKAQLDATET